MSMRWGRTVPLILGWLTTSILPVRHSRDNDSETEINNSYVSSMAVAQQVPFETALDVARRYGYTRN